MRGLLPRFKCRGYAGPTKKSPPKKGLLPLLWAVLLREFVGELPDVNTADILRRVPLLFPLNHFQDLFNLNDDVQRRRFF
jgi:hypothetical protein